MPRGAYLDALAIPHHVRVRGNERRSIFRGGRGREDFVACHGGRMADEGILGGNSTVEALRRGALPVLSGRHDIDGWRRLRRLRP